MDGSNKGIGRLSRTHAALQEQIKPSIPGAVRQVRRYLTPAENPVTGKAHDYGYDYNVEKNDSAGEPNGVTRDWVPVLRKRSDRPNTGLAVGHGNRTT